MMLTWKSCHLLELSTCGLIITNLFLCLFGQNCLLFQGPTPLLPLLLFSLVMDPTLDITHVFCVHSPHAGFPSYVDLPQSHSTSLQAPELFLYIPDFPPQMSTANSLFTPDSAVVPIGLFPVSISEYSNPYDLFTSSAAPPNPDSQ